MNDKASITISSSVCFDTDTTKAASFYEIAVRSDGASHGFLTLDSLDQIEQLRDAINEYLHLNNR